MSVPAEVAVDDTELKASLQRALADHLKETRPIARIRRCPSAYRSSFALEEIEVEFEDAPSLHLVFKDLSPTAILNCAREVKPAFLYEPLREIETYRRLLATNGLRTAKFYGATVEPPLARYWLFLEKVPGIELYQVGDFETWERAARWLARLHGYYAVGSLLLQDVGSVPLLRYDAEYYRCWLKRARSIPRCGQTPAHGQRMQSVDRLLDAYERVIPRLLEMPPTLIHGEFYASNVLVVKGDPVRVCPIDWEMAAIGPGLMDLAALTAGQWSEEERARLALAYRAELLHHGCEVAELDALSIDLDRCRLHLAVQWLSWSTGWAPPPEHAQDWLREASRILDRLWL